ATCSTRYGIQLGLAVILIAAARSSDRAIASAGAGSALILSTACRIGSGNSPSWFGSFTVQLLTECRVDRPLVTNPKSEARNPKQIQSTKKKTQNVKCVLSDFEFRILNLFRISNFVLRISSL